MIKLEEGLWKLDRGKPGGKFGRIVSTWHDLEKVGLRNPEKTLIVPPNSRSLKQKDYSSILDAISQVFGHQCLAFRSDANFEDKDRRSAGVLESRLIHSPLRKYRRTAINDVLDSINSPAAQAYLKKHKIKNAKVGIGIQSIVTRDGKNQSEPDLAGVVNSAFNTKIEITMVKGLGYKLNSGSPKYKTIYKRGDGRIRCVSLGEFQMADENEKKALLKISRYVINAVLQLEEEWKISGSKGIDLEFAVRDKSKPESTVHVQNNLLDIPGEYEVPELTGQKLGYSPGVIGHEVFQSEQYISFIDSLQGDDSFLRYRGQLREFNSNHKGYVMFVHDSGLGFRSFYQYGVGRKKTIVGSRGQIPNGETFRHLTLNFLDYDLICNAGSIIILGKYPSVGFSEMPQHLGLLARSDGINILYLPEKKALNVLEGICGAKVCSSEKGVKLTTTVVCDQEKNKGQVYIARK